jgi:hypothetical protein
MIDQFFHGLRKKQTYHFSLSAKEKNQKIIKIDEEDSE